MFSYNTLYEFDSSWRVTSIAMTRPLGEYAVNLSVSFAKADDVVSLEFLRIDGPQNIIELMDFQNVTVSEEVDSDRDFCTIKVELVADSYAEFWCDAVSMKSTL